MNDASRSPGRLRLSAVLGHPDFVPLVFFVVSIAAFVLIPLLTSGILVGDYDFFISLQTFAAFGIVALALSATMIVGEFDLSVVGSYGLGALVAVLLGQSNPYLGLLAAIAVGVVAGLVQGLIITKLGLGSVPVTLGGLLVLQGPTIFISGSRNVPFSNIPFSLMLDQQIIGFVSVRMLITLLLCALAGTMLWATAAGRLMRAVGGNRAASRSVGLPVDRTVTSVFVLSGALSAFAGTLTSFALASAQTNVGTQPLIFAVTAALIGGVSLAGGRGTVLGVTAAAIGLSLIQGIFQVLALPVFFANLVMGAVLIVIVAAQAPGLLRRLRAFRAARSSRLLIAQT